MSISSSELNFNPSVAGFWHTVSDSLITVNYSGSVATKLYAALPVGADGREGLIAGGWSYNGFDNQATDTIPVSMLVLEQQADGTMRVKTSDYLPNSQTKGVGAVLVADFNSDGFLDVFLAGHNESPFISRPSIALMGNRQGGFDRIEVGNPVMAHDAALIQFNDRPAVLTSPFNNDRQNNPHSPIFFWEGSGFTWVDTPIRATSGAIGMSANLADLNGDGQLEMAIGDLIFGPGVAYSPSNKFKVALYPFINGDIGSAPLKVITPYFEQTPPYSSISSDWGPGATHTYRIWLEDFNHDGKMDMLAGQSLWKHEVAAYPSMLGMLQNEGDLNFVDKSGSLGTALILQMQEPDYNLRMVDLDGSGIKSYISGKDTDMQREGSKFTINNNVHPNFIALNDGTGKLHLVMRDQFLDMGRQVLNYAQNLYSDPNVLYVPDQPLPSFKAYLTLDNKINFVAQIRTFKFLPGGVGADNQLLLVNVPTQLDVFTAYDTPVVIDDRNHSQLMRTFAGNDTILNVNPARNASIDGGLGIDKVAYGFSAAVGTLTRLQDGNWQLLTDTQFDLLKRVERVEFSDRKFALDLNAGAGQLAKLYGAILGKDSVLNKEWVGLGLQAIDSGMTNTTLAQSLLSLVLGTNSTSTNVVKTLWQNLFLSSADEAVISQLTALLDSGAYSAAELAVAAGETDQNKINIGFTGLVENGLAYV